MNISLLHNNTVSKYINICIYLFFGAFCIRFFEYFLLTSTHNFEPQDCLISNIKGLFFDIIYFGKISIILFPLFAVGYHFAEKATTLIFRIVLSLTLLISCGLVSFYSIAEFPLDRVVFVYTLNDIVDIVSSSNNAAWWTYAVIIAIPVLFFVFSKKQLHFTQNKATTIIATIVFLCTIFIPNIQYKYFNTNKNYHTAENKLMFMFKSLAQKTEDASEMDEEQYNQTVQHFRNKFPDLNFVEDYTYPFLHKDNSPDVLSQYFNLKEEKPNFVFIVVEGLSREFSGENPLVPSATPFIDSLSRKGLTWNNCLSTSQRTICALPSIFGALPFGKSGFMNYKENAPDFNSLLTILHDNNYTSSFFYGGWLCFDDMCHFLKLNKVDNYLNVSLYDTVSQKNSWGLFDDFMFNESIKSIDFNKSPRIDVYLTLTTHDPFEYPDDKKYTEIYTKILHDKKFKGIPENQIRNYASYLYLDESVRMAIEKYKSDKSFENTIFIITGDHDFNTWQEPMISHHVPLIIWSPLLKTHKQFPALVSHRDITPSVLAMLKSNYNITSPQNVAWINTGLDTSKKFRSRTFSPLMDVGRNLNRFVYKDLFYQDGNVYRISYKNNQIELSETTDTVDFQKMVTNYKSLDLFVIESNALIENALHEKEWNINKVVDIATVKEFRNLYKDKIQDNSEKMYMGKNSATEFNDVFPFTFYSYKIQDKDEIIKLRLTCKFNIPSISDSVKNISLIRVVTEISRNGNQLYWADENINNLWFPGYNKWFEFSMNNILQRENYDYCEGDVITFYIWNSSKRTFYLSDLKLNLQTYSEKK